MDVDLSNLSSTAQRDLAQVIDALSHIIEATSTSTPPWLETFAEQVENGVTAPDLYLTNIKGIARGLITNMEAVTNQGMADLNTETEQGDPLVHKMRERFAEYDDPDDFAASLRGADQIGTQRGNRVTGALSDWEPALAPDHEPPFITTAREFMPGWGTSATDTPVSSSADSDGQMNASDSGYTSTSLSDFQ